MENRDIHQDIFDLWHFCMFLKELDGQTMTLSTIRKWKVRPHLLASLDSAVSIADAILETWTQAHDYQNMLIKCRDQVRRRNMQINDKNKEIDMLTQKIEDMKNYPATEGYHS